MELVSEVEDVVALTETSTVVWVIGSVPTDDELSVAASDDDPGKVLEPTVVADVEDVVLASVSSGVLTHNPANPLPAASP